MPLSLGGFQKPGLQNSRNYKLPLSSGWLAAFILAVVICQLPADAGAYMYAGKRRVINCGVLDFKHGIVNDNPTLNQPLDPIILGSATSAVGNLFYLLDIRTDLKPSGWSFENPYAPVNPGTGQRYEKYNPQYWLVNLQTTRDLSRLNVLYLPGSGAIDLNDEDREKLRKFVDAGGVLWIDNSGSPQLSFTTGMMTTEAGSFLIPYFYFRAAGGGFDTAWVRHHPLLTLPYWLDDREITMLGRDWGRNACNVLFASPTGDIPPQASDVLFPVVAKNGSGANDASVVANAYGSGRIIGTANFVGGGCCLAYPYCNPSLKLAYNIIAWASSWTDLRKDPRHTGHSIDTVGGSSLVKLWTAGDPPNGESGAVIYKNVGFYSSGSKLIAVDVLPSEDLDHDGNPDDGEQGTGSDRGADIIWQVDLGEGNLSTPTIVTCQDPRDPTQMVEAVVVLTSQCKVYLLQAFPNNGGVLIPQTPQGIIYHWSTLTARHVSSPVSTTSWTKTPQPVAYNNGWFYALTPDGRLHAFNPVLDKWKGPTPNADRDAVPSDFLIPGPDWETALKAQKPGFKLGAAVAGPNFGYVNAGNSTALIGMVYWCAHAPTESSDGLKVAEEGNDYLYGVPVYVRNDRLKREAVSNDGKLSEYRVTYRTSKITSRFPTPVIRIVPNTTLIDKSKGVDGIEVNKGLDSTGKTYDKLGSILIYTQTSLPGESIIYADYAINYEPSYTGWPSVKFPLSPSSQVNIDQPVPPSFIAATPAMSYNNTMYVTASRLNPTGGSLPGQSTQAIESAMGLPGDSIFAIRTDGAQSQSTRWHYMLHSGINTGGVTAGLLQGTSTPTLPIPGLLWKKPASVNANDIEAATIAQPRVSSSPVVVGDKMFVTVTGKKGGAILCLKTNSDAVIRIMDNMGLGTGSNVLRKPKQLWDSNGRPYSISLWQPDVMCATAPLGPMVENIPVPNAMIDRTKGTVTVSFVDQMRLRNQFSQQTNTLSTSLPVWVLVDGVEVPIDWSTWGPTNALAKLMNVTIPDPPQGDCIDLSGWCNLLWYYVPDGCTGISHSPVVIGDNVYFVTDDGMIYCIDSETGETTGKPFWGKDPKFMLWEEPIVPGPTPLTGNNLNVSPAGSNGVLLVPGPEGLCGYANPSTLIADRNRLVEVDSGGDVRWSLDSIMMPESAPELGYSAGSNVPRLKIAINKPSRARYTETGEILLVNTGSNMVCKIDKSGNVGIQKVVSVSQSGGDIDSWIKMSYDKFSDPKHLLRPGQSLTLSNPMDAITWSELEPGPNNQAFAMHCIIADSGNSRILDLVFRFKADGHIINETFDGATGYILPDLNWVSNTESKAEKYVFECLQLVTNPIDNNGPLVQNIWAAISNYRTDNNPNREGLGGAIVELNYRSRASDENWDYGAAKTGQINSGCLKVDLGSNGGIQPLACPRFFQVIDKSDGRSLLICDNRGVYKVNLAGAPTAPPVTQHLYHDEFRDMLDRDGSVAGVQALPFQLSAMSVQEMMNGRWLIANGYAGSISPWNKTYVGEVFEFDPSITNPANSAPNWCSPKLQIKFPNGPGGAIGTWEWSQLTGSSYNIQQPRSAFRQF